MDERLRISLWVVGGGGLGAVLGGAFGGLTGALYAQNGGTAGTGFGRSVADAFARGAEEEPSPVRQGAITGAADGVLFLGIVGIVTGACVAIIGGAHPRWLGVAALGSFFLVGGAALFGVLAYGMTRNGGGSVLSVFAGGLLGSALAGVLLGADRCLVGTIPGLLAGLLLSFVTRRYAPTFRPPRVGKGAPRRRSDASTDITEPLHPPSKDDSFQKPNSFDNDEE
jgi:hypothetical protein